MRSPLHPPVSSSPVRLTAGRAAAGLVAMLDDGSGSINYKELAKTLGGLDPLLQADAAGDIDTDLTNTKAASLGGARRPRCNPTSWCLQRHAAALWCLCGAGRSPMPEHMLQPYVPQASRPSLGFSSRTRIRVRVPRCQRCSRRTPPGGRRWSQG